jgi:RNA polymerase subunit RPABC4/transcription elongation factor Spt4
MKDIINKLDNILNEGHLGQMADRVELDHEVQMARADLYKLAKYSIKLHDMLKNVSELNGIDGWQASKITKAADYIGSVYHSMDAETGDAEAEMDALADVIMPAEHDHKVCADCGDKMHEPTTDCPHDCHDEQGDNWVDEKDLDVILDMDEAVNDLAKLSGITKEETTKGTKRTDGSTNSKFSTPDIGMTADTTSGQEPGAEEEAQKELDKMTPDQKKKALGMTTKNESKFSDWGKK